MARVQEEALLVSSWVVILQFMGKKNCKHLHIYLQQVYDLITNYEKSRYYNTSLPNIVSHAS